MLIKRSNALELIATTRDDIWLRSQSTLRKDKGTLKMISSKHTSRVLRDAKNKEEDKLPTDFPKISLPLAIFDCLRENIALINAHSTTKSMRSILSLVVPLVIPSLKERSELSHSKHAICNLLGINDNNILTQHCFKICEKMSALRLLKKGDRSVGMIEDVLIPIER